LLFGGGGAYPVFNAPIDHSTMNNNLYNHGLNDCFVLSDAKLQTSARFSSFVVACIPVITV